MALRCWNAHTFFSLKLTCERTACISGWEIASSGMEWGMTSTRPWAYNHSGFQLDRSCLDRCTKVETRCWKHILYKLVCINMSTIGNAHCTYPVSTDCSTPIFWVTLTTKQVSLGSCGGATTCFKSLRPKFVSASKRPTPLFPPVQYPISWSCWRMRFFFGGMTSLVVTGLYWHLFIDRFFCTL